MRLALLFPPEEMARLPDLVDSNREFLELLQRSPITLA
jgi:hypothetical protein